MNLLLTSIGKRIQLIEHLKTQFRVIGVDASAQNAAKHFVDSFHLIPRCKESGYVDALLDICKKEKIDLLIPLFELEFPYLCAARARFEEIGTTLILSETAVIDICNDKKRTAAFFEKYRIPAPKTLPDELVQSDREDVQEKELSFPLIIKPLDGMGSEGVFRVNTKEEFSFFKKYVKNPIVQTCAVGTEYTMDVLCDLQGAPVYIVPRVRLEVRSGEVSKSRVRLHPLVLSETEKLLQDLNKEGTVIGPMTIQCFMAEDEKSLSFIEINPRFGGGVPLSFAAGADYAKQLRQMAEQKEACPSYKSQQVKELTMLRYDQAVYEG